MTTTVLTKGANHSIPRGDERNLIAVTIEVDSDDGLVTDASVLLIGGHGKVRSNDDLIFYNQPSGADGAVRLLERSDADDGASRDTVEIDLDGLPDDVDRIVIGASIDDESTTLGAASATTMIVSTTTGELARFPIDGLTSERALIFGEVYRRAEDWKVRAVGQGYDAGLAHLVEDFGVEVDDNGTADGESIQDPTADRTVADDRASDETEPANVRIRRPRRAPAMPADWKDRVSPYLPTRVSSGVFHRATVFPTTTTKSGTNHEQRATSTLLASMEIVREFGRAVLASIGAPGGRIECFVEPAFQHDGAEARPDGLIRVTRGSTTWTALVEVKIGNRRLDPGQIDTYLAVAKAHGFDAVITISTDLHPVTGGAVVDGDPRLRKSVSLHHVAWEEIIAAAAMTLQHTKVENRERQRLLYDFLEFALHPSSGMHVFDDMGSHWVRVREAVNTRTISPRDSAPNEICQNFDRLVRHAALELSALIGQRVQALPPSEHRDAVSRTRQLADSGQMFGTIRTAGLLGPMIVEANLARERAIVSMTFTAPKAARTATQVNWLLRQLTGVNPRTRVVSHHSGNREKSAALLKDALDDPSTLLPKDGRGIREFTVSYDQSTGTKRSGSSGGFAVTVTQLILEFYDEVGTVLRST